MKFDPTHMFSRCVFSPRDLASGSGQPLCFKYDLSFQKPLYRESVNCNQLLETYPTDVHVFGRAQAALRTARNRENGKAGQEYEGFCQADFETIESVRVESHGFTVVSSPIPPGEEQAENPAHCDIQLLFDGSKPGKAQKEYLCEHLGKKFLPLVPVE